MSGAIGGAGGGTIREPMGRPRALRMADKACST